MLRKLINLALPIMAANFLQTLYNLVDSYFLGKLGKEALAAPSIAFTIILFLIIFAGGFANAGTTLISQARGAGNQERVDFYLGQLVTAMTLLSFVLGFIGYITVDPLLRLLQTPEGATFIYTSQYLKIIFAGVPMMFMMFIFRAALQGVGDGITPLVIQVVTVFLNVFLDWILIFGIGPFPRWEVQGAAAATVAARSVASLIGLFILLRGTRHIRLKLSTLKPDKEALKLLFRIGMPSSLGQGVSALGFTVLQGVVNGLGPAVIAAFGIGNRIIALFNMPAQGLCQATAVLVGQNLGSGSTARAREVVSHGVRMIVIFITLGMTLTFFKGASVIHFFITDPEVTEIGVVMFRILSPSVIFFSLYTVLLGAFQGGGDAKPPMVLNIIRLWGLRVPLAYLMILVLGMGALGLWWAMFVSNLVVAAAAWILYETNRWSRALDPQAL